MNPDEQSLADILRGGLIPAVPVPFDQRGQIDAESHWKYIRWMKGQAVAAVAVWVHTGRGLWLSDEQREDVLTSWREGAPELPIICGVGVPRNEELPADPRARTDRVVALTVRMAEAALAGGAQGLMVHPPGALASLPDVETRLADLHAAVATATGLPVLAFHLYQAASGLPYTPGMVRRLLGVPGVIGIKLATLDSVMTFQELAGTVAEFEHALLVTGEDRFLGYSLMMGAHCALIGMGAACTDLTARLLDAWYERRLPEFVHRSAIVDSFAHGTFTAPMEGYVQRMLLALQADGVLEGDPRDPFGPELSQEDRESVRDLVRALREV